MHSKLHFRHILVRDYHYSVCEIYVRKTCYLTVQFSMLSNSNSSSSRSSRGRSRERGLQDVQFYMFFFFNQNNYLFILNMQNYAITQSTSSSKVKNCTFEVIPNKWTKTELHQPNIRSAGHMEGDRQCFTTCKMSPCPFSSHANAATLSYSLISCSTQQG